MRYFIVAGIFLLCSFSARHPVHVSVSSVEENIAENIFEITFKIFVDDLETAVSKSSGIPVRIGINNQITPDNGQDLLKKYILEQFYWKVNEKKMEMEYMGFEANHESAWVYFQVNGCNVSGHMEMRNTILFNVHDDQSNITHFKSSKGKTSALFNAASPVKEISIK